jgi:hypothetical protein
MNHQAVHVTMFKMLSATIVYSIGISLTFGGAIVAFAAMLQ